jgi:ferrochelatase
MEVVYDLDTEAMATAQRLGLRVVRAGTPGVDPGFVAALRELALDRGTPDALRGYCSAHCCLPEPVTADA